MECLITKITVTIDQYEYHYGFLSNLSIFFDMDTSFQFNLEPGIFSRIDRQRYWFTLSKPSFRGNNLNHPSTHVTGRPSLPGPPKPGGFYLFEDSR